MKNLFKYIEDGITIDKTKTGYSVFTIPTQRFKINSLDELTPERFEVAIAAQKEYEDSVTKMFESYHANLQYEPTQTNTNGN